MERIIPGCTEVSPEDVQKALNDGNLPYHQVHGRWYAIKPGHDSLEKLVDEWLEEVLSIWYHVSYEVDGVRTGNYTKTAHDAERTLREWGWIDENGIPVERE
jgi:hypothetical protein